MPLKRFVQHFNFSFRIGSVNVHTFPTENLFSVGKEITAAPPHTHGDWELRYFESGKAICSVSDSNISCTPGHYLLLPPHTLHFLSLEECPTAQEDCRHYTLRFSLHNLQDSPGLDTYFSKVQLVRADSPLILQLFTALREVLQYRNPNLPVSAQGILQALMAEVLCQANVDTKLLFPDRIEQFCSEINGYVDNYFALHFREKCSIHDLAQQLDVPASVVNRTIRELYGMSFTKKLQLMRIECAKALLRDTDQTVLDISISSGFGSSNAFYNAFYKLESCSPTQYRAAYRNSEQEEKKRDWGDSSS